jgi:hypothetical protein
MNEEQEDEEQAIQLDEGQEDDVKTAFSRFENARNRFLA